MIETNAPRAISWLSRYAPFRWLFDLIRRFWAVPFLRYLVAGGINTLFGYALFATFTLLHFHYVVSLTLGTIIGILFNFNTTGRMVFHNKDARRITGFFMVYGVTFLVNLGALRVFDLFHVSMLIAAAILAIPVAFLGYALNRRFVFRQSTRQRP